MNVASYIFQSPSPNAVQVGRLDPSSVANESGSSSASSAPIVNQTQVEAKSFQATQTQEVTPEVSSTAQSTSLLDIYV